MENSSTNSLQQELPLLGGQPAKRPWERWYILAVFFLVSCSQSTVWFTYSSAPAAAMDFYRIGAAEVDLLLNWGSIIPVALTLPVAWLFSARGLRPAVLLGAGLTLLCCLLRAIPCLGFSEDVRHAMRPLLHVAQVICGVAAPIVLSPVSLLSATWFPETERARATSIAVLANNCGIPVAFLLGPALADSADHFPRLVYATLAFSAIPFALVVAHFPSAPLNAPSAAVAARPLQAREFLSGTLACLKSPALLLNMIATGSTAGLFYSFSGTMQLSLTGLSSDTIGWLGFAMSIAGIIGSLVAGAVVDRWLGRKMKESSMLAMVACAVGFFAYSVCVPSVFRSEAIFSVSTTALGVILSLTGLAWGTINPIMYEFAAESTYPVSEIISGSLIATWMCAVMLVVLFVAPEIAVATFNITVVATFAVCAFLVMFIKEEYKRRDVDEKKENETLASVNECSCPVRISVM